MRYAGGVMGIPGLQVIVVSHLGPPVRMNTQPRKTASRVSNLTDFCEHGNESSGFAKGEQYCHQQEILFQILCKDSSPW
jgi:hypothetical protein